MVTEIKFGTDGWRGVIAQDFTFDNVRLCAQSVANYVQDAGMVQQGLIVGYDTRFASEHFAAAAAEVVAANGIKVYLCPQAAPTPVITYGVLNRKTAGAIIITASHNPAIWNGFKFKSHQATSASPEIIAQIERHIADIHSRGAVRRLPLDEGMKRGLIEYLDLKPTYLHHIAELVDMEMIRGAGLKVVIDSMYGAGAGYLKTLLEGGSTEVKEINGERNPLFPGIRPEPIAANLEKLSATIKETEASVGLATDGDADRIGITDERGTFLNQLQVFALLALYFLEVRGERGAIVKTLTTTSMLYRLGELFQVPVYETPVGFKYVAPIVISEDALIGGEESGGYSFRHHVPDRDGILAGIYFLDLMVRLGKTPSELLEYLFSKVGPHYYQRTDITFPPSERGKITDLLAHSKPDSIENTEVAKIDPADGFRFILTDGSWLLIRFSGTEPILRIYAESSSIAKVKELLIAGRNMTGV